MQLAYDRTGSGPPLVLIHGIGSRRGVWKPVVERLARERDVLCVDLPGFGESPVLASRRRRSRRSRGRCATGGRSWGSRDRTSPATRSAAGSRSSWRGWMRWPPRRRCRRSASGARGRRATGGTMLHVTHFAATRLGAQMRALVRLPGRTAGDDRADVRPAGASAMAREAVEDLVQLARAPGWEATLPHDARVRLPRRRRARRRARHDRLGHARPAADPAPGRRAPAPCCRVPATCRCRAAGTSR